MILPTLEEQDNIVARLDREAARVGDVIDKTMREISLLREHRTRLIADVVAGKVDVRDGALMTLDDDLPEAADTREDQGEDETADPEEAGDADE